jgi:transcriptional regulator GlxA family with amidase domain
VTLLALELHRKLVRSVRTRFENCPSVGDAERLGRLREYVVADRDPDFGVQSLADACGMSPRALSALLMRSAGVTLRTFAAAARLERAKLLLAREDGLVKQVAYRCGFKGTAAFGSAFRKALGITPQQYRQLHNARR